MNEALSGQHKTAAEPLPSDFADTPCGGWCLGECPGCCGCAARGCMGCPLGEQLDADTIARLRER